MDNRRNFKINLSLTISIAILLAFCLGLMVSAQQNLVFRGSSHIRATSFAHSHFSG